IDLVERTVHDANDDVDHRVAGDRAVVPGLHDSGNRGLDDFLRNRTADDLVEDLNSLTLLVRLELDANVAVLALAARLPDELALGFGGLGDGFAVGDLRLAGGRLDLELPLHAVADDVEVKLAHAGKNRLAAVRI